MNPACRLMAATGAGQVSRSFAAINGIEPMITGSTTDLATLISNLSGGYLGLPTSTTYTTLSVFGTATVNRATIGGSSTHFKNVVNDGLFVMKGMSASQGGVASSNLEVHCIYDGTNLPFAYATGVSLPATPAVSQLFTLGPASYSGSAISGVTNLDFDLGITVKKESSDGEDYPTYCYIDAIDPKITLTLKDASFISTIGLTGTSQGATASTFYLRAKQQGQMTYANNATQHIKVTVNSNQGIAWAQDASFQSSTGECKIVIYPIVGSSAVVSMTSGVAIT
jgi:hypothetical protein